MCDFNQIAPNEQCLIYYNLFVIFISIGLLVEKQLVLILWQKLH